MLRRVLWSVPLGMVHANWSAFPIFAVIFPAETNSGIFFLNGLDCFIIDKLSYTKFLRIMNSYCHVIGCNAWRESWLYGSWRKFTALDAASLLQGVCFGNCLAGSYRKEAMAVGNRHLLSYIPSICAEVKQNMRRITELLPRYLPKLQTDLDESSVPFLQSVWI